MIRRPKLLLTSNGFEPYGIDLRMERAGLARDVHRYRLPLGRWREGGPGVIFLATHAGLPRRDPLCGSPSSMIRPSCAMPSGWAGC
jgi:hypothetical protein